MMTRMYVEETPDDPIVERIDEEEYLEIEDIEFSDEFEEEKEMEPFVLEEDPRNNRPQAAQIQMVELEEGARERAIQEIEEAIKARELEESKNRGG